MDTRLIGIIMAFTLSSCAAVQGMTTPRPVAPKAAAGQLAPQNLGAGQCAMFVWERTAPNRFILFTQASARSGQWYDGTQSRAARVTSQGETNAQRQSSVQSLISGDKVLELSLGDAQTITDGTRYKEGVLRVSGGAEFDRVIPVVGLSSCGR